MTLKARDLVVEGLGTAFLLATVAGSGIMAEQLAGGNVALALLANTIATGAILFVLITIWGPVSGAHFNPAVSLAMALNREVETKRAVAYIAVQVIGAILGVWIAHAMFELPILQLSEKVRTGPSQWLAEFVATFGLLTVIFATLRANPQQIAATVGLYITAAYWFTASTSFANPAVTLARSLTDTFSGIRAADAPGFIIAQIAGMLTAVAVERWIRRQK